MSEEKRRILLFNWQRFGCCKGVKLLVMLLIGAFIFASGMWFAKSHCGIGAQFLSF